MADPVKHTARGPFRADQIREGDRYELSSGHPVYCAPTGARGGRANLVGGEVLETDPNVEQAGIDVGYSAGPRDLRAPDVSVGNVPNTPGWVEGVPPLALEYADSGQDESELQDKIRDLLAAGTRHVWVARLVGPRRVEVYEPGVPMRLVDESAELHAPGILKNPVRVRALFDRDAAHESVLRNLLQRRGYDDLDSVRREGREQGREQGEVAAARRALHRVLERRGLALSDAQRGRIDTCRDIAELEHWQGEAAVATTTDEALLTKA